MRTNKNTPELAGGRGAKKLDNSFKFFDYEANDLPNARHLPPYGKQIADARARGFIPRKKGLGHVVIVLGWDEPSGAMPRIVIPPGTDPNRVNLAFLAGLHVTVSHLDIHTHANRVKPIVGALLVAGARPVDVINRQALLRGETAWARIEGVNHG